MLSDNPARELRFICVLAMPRTGSSHLAGLMKNCPQFNVKQELFHPVGTRNISAADLAAMKQKSGNTVQDDKSLCSWRAAHPTETIETLYEVGGSRPLVFKLFPGHLTRERMSSEIFARNDVAYVLLKRRPIESFISSLKARTLKTHKTIDTTAIKPALSVQPFIQWGQRAKSWYDWLEHELSSNNLPRADLGYERHLESTTSTDALAVVLDALKTIGFGVPAMPAKVTTIARQDRESNYRDRVANWAQFEQEAKHVKKAAKLLEWAETAP